MDVVAFPAIWHGDSLGETLLLVWFGRRNAAPEGVINDAGYDMPKAYPDTNRGTSLETNLARILRRMIPGNKKRDLRGPRFVFSILSSVYHIAMGEPARFSGNISGVESWS